MSASPSTDRFVFVSSDSAVEIARAAGQLESGPGRHLAVFVAEEERPDLDDLVRELRALDVPFFGGLFPGLIHGDQRMQSGTLVLSLPSEIPPLLVTGLDQPRIESRELDEVAAGTPEPRTAVVLVDGLTANVSRLLAELHRRLGNTVHYVGGGAGSLSLVQEPCVFTSEGVFQDAAVISFVSKRSSLGVRHGWKYLAGPLIATRTEGNVIHELNWERAFDIYRDAIQSNRDVELSAETLFTDSTAFPFGIYKEGEEDVVRDPISTGESGELVCVGEVPENAVLNVLEGNRASLIEAAAQAAEDCSVAEGATDPMALVVDCVSRTMFLDDEFPRELAVVRERLKRMHPDLETLGLLTLGEISSHGEGFVEFLNKTLVVAVLHD